MRVRAHFKNIDEVIAIIKAATIKKNHRKKDFHDAALSSPSDPVITRWVIGLELPYNAVTVATTTHFFVLHTN